MSNIRGMEIIIVSGMSGSGKNSINNVIEDLGYFCIDNMPAELITELLNVYAISSNMDMDRAFATVGNVPVHPGAAKYYREMGMTVENVADLG